MILYLVLFFMPVPCFKDLFSELTFHFPACTLFPEVRLRGLVPARRLQGRRRYHHTHDMTRHYTTRHDTTSNRRQWTHNAE